MFCFDFLFYGNTRISIIVTGEVVGGLSSHDVIGGNGSFLCILRLNNKRILNELKRKHGDNVVRARGRSYRAAGRRRGMEEEKG